MQNGAKTLNFTQEFYFSRLEVFLFLCYLLPGFPPSSPPAAATINPFRALTSQREAKRIKVFNPMNGCRYTHVHSLKQNFDDEHGYAGPF